MTESDGVCALCSTLLLIMMGAGEGMKDVDINFSKVKQTSKCLG